MTGSHSALRSIIFFALDLFLRKISFGTKPFLGTNLLNIDSLMCTRVNMFFLPVGTMLVKGPSIIANDILGKFSFIQSVSTKSKRIGFI